MTICHYFSFLRKKFTVTGFPLAPTLNLVIFKIFDSSQSVFCEIDMLPTALGGIFKVFSNLLSTIAFDSLVMILTFPFL